MFIYVINLRPEDHARRLGAARPNPCGDIVDKSLANLPLANTTC